MTLNRLSTLRGESHTGTPWDVYPRPQLRRDSFLNLNGTWDFTATDGNAAPDDYDRKITVPFCPECELSGIGEHFPEGSLLCYRRIFRLPEGFLRDRVLLHMGAADQVCDIYVNQKHVGHHEGGYTAFRLDITDALEEINELRILVRDSLDDQSFPYGKQTKSRGGMWYTPVSGIWQTVWLESVPAEYIQSLDIRVTATAAHITVTPPLAGSILLEGKEYPLTDGKASIAPDSPRLWTPEDPWLYRFSVITETDRVESYFALRTLEIREVKGLPRLCLNGEPYFFHGLLDQGYWPEGIYTPPAPESFADDILAMKRLGFNTLRKHIKVEPEQFYYDCDRLGMIVFQDMVNNSDYRFFRDTALPTVGIQKLPDRKLHRDPRSRQAFLECMEQTVAQLKNHPCIVYWTVFNEGWGQFDSSAVCKRLRQLDDSRFIDSTSGWFRGGDTDVESLHIYFGPWGKLKPCKRPLVLSEFGGYAYPVEGHIFNPEKAYGYKSCRSLEDFQTSMEALYHSRILPAVPNGLCAAIYTQVSDVEDEINGLLTYDRKFCKANEAAMTAIAQLLREALSK